MTMRLFSMYDDLLLLQALDGRDEYIYHDDNPPCTEKSRESSSQGGYRESGEGETCKPILDFVSLVRPLLELQREERHLAYQEIAVMRMSANTIQTDQTLPLSQNGSKTIREPQKRALAGVGTPMKEVV